jgi:hypothetical protein
MSRNYAGGVQEGADKRNTYNRRVTEKDACAEWLLLSEAVVKAVNKVYAAKSPAEKMTARESERAAVAALDSPLRLYSMPGMNTRETVRTPYCSARVR